MLKFQKQIKGIEAVVAVRNMFRRGDGLYKVNEDTYIITFCHGDEQGELGLQINDTMYDVSPDTLRSTLQDVLQYKLPTESRLFITPCFPSTVREVCGKELAKHNIFVEGNWNAITNWNVISSRNNKLVLILNSREEEDF